METSCALSALGDPDDVLAERARGGCRASFAALVHRHQAYVFRLALRVSGHHHDAEDISQETFLLAYRSIGSFRGTSHFRTWMCQIALNAALMRKRATRRRPTVALDDIDMPSTGDEADELLERRRLSRHAFDVLERLDESQRVAFVLCELEGLPSAEAAGMVCTSTAAVRERAYRARRTLRACLEKDLES